MIDKLCQAVDTLMLPTNTPGSGCQWLLLKAGSHPAVIWMGYSIWMLLSNFSLVHSQLQLKKNSDICSSQKERADWAMLSTLSNFFLGQLLKKVVHENLTLIGTRIMLKIVGTTTVWKFCLFSILSYTTLAFIDFTIIQGVKLGNIPSVLFPCSQCILLVLVNCVTKSN